MRHVALLTLIVLASGCTHAFTQPTPRMPLLEARSLSEPRIDALGHGAKITVDSTATGPMRVLYDGADASAIRVLEGSRSFWISKETIRSVRRRGDGMPGGGVAAIVLGGMVVLGLVIAGAFALSSAMHGMSMGFGTGAWGN